MVLLEVLLALTIFAIVSLGLVMALNQSFGAAEDRNQADAVARGLRNQLVLLHGGPLAPGSRELPVDPAASETRYRLEVSAVPMSDQRKQPLLGLYRATITAQWKSGDRVEQQSISELVYQP